MTAYKRNICCVIGTRPEAVKMAPLVHLLRDRPWARCQVVVTGQHRELLDSMLDFFGIDVDDDLDAMRRNQTPDDLLPRLLVDLQASFDRRRPELVVAQGDTTTVLAAALAAFGRQIPFAHVEAGLRTHNLSAPFPEEGNRVLADRIAALHFAPTSGARDNLLREGISAATIHVVGNTVVDALRWARNKDADSTPLVDPPKRLILVTTHRRESFGRPLQNICRAVAELARIHDDVEVVWPVHPNPAVASTVKTVMAGRPRIHLREPLSYGAFAAAMQRACFIMSDSGGIQEEASVLGTPLLILRDLTERSEAIDAGGAQLVGTDYEAIVEAGCQLLGDVEFHRRMSRPSQVFGDGLAAERIVRTIENFLGVDSDARRCDRQSVAAV